VELLPAQNLASYLDAAISNSPVFRENENRTAIAGLEVAKAKAVYNKPEVSTTANFLYAPVIQGIGYDVSITNGAWYSALLNLNMPLFKGKEIDAQTRNSEVLQQTFIQNSLLSRHELARQVTEQYILTWQNLERLSTTQKLLDLLTQQEKLVRVFAQNAILSQSDVLFFTIEKENQQLALHDYQMAYRQGLAQLNLICGRVDTAFVELTQPDIQLNDSTAAFSHFMNSFYLDSLLMDGQQEIAELAYRPQVSAFANTGLNAIMLSDIYQKFGMSAGINFSLTLFDGNQRELTRQQMQLNQKTNSVQKEFQANQILQQRLAAYQQIYMLDAKIKALQRQLSDYETLLKFYRERIAQGELSVNDYMNTIRSFAAAQADLTSLKTARLLLLNTYNYWNW
jgi:outer membrane protein TolC